MFFYVAVLIIALACSTITIKTLVGYSSIKLVYKLIISLLILAGWFAPVWLAIVRNNVSNSLYTLLTNIGYTLFGFLFLLFIILMLRDVVWYGIYGAARLMNLSSWSINPKNISLLDHANVIVVVTSVLLSSYALYAGLKAPAVKELTITSPKIAEDMRVVQLSDLHITRATPITDIYALVNQINDLQPHAIFMTGDIIDDDVAMIDEHLNALQSLIAPYGVYASNGNHEFYNNLHAWSTKFASLGIKVLFNKGYLLNNSNVFVSGIPDAQAATSHPNFNVNFVKALQGSSPENYKILLSHNPDMIDNITSISYSLQLSGHTHGGQIFPFHLLVKKANKYLAGSYNVNGVHLYVNRGAGTWGPSMRLFAPSEITLISFKSQK